MTPLTRSPRARARSANRPASSGAHPQRGRPTLTSISTSRTAGTRRCIDGGFRVDSQGHARACGNDRGEAPRIHHFVGKQQVGAEASGRHLLDLAQRRAGKTRMARANLELRDGRTLVCFYVRPQLWARKCRSHHREIVLKRFSVDEEGGGYELADPRRIPRHSRASIQALHSTNPLTPACVSPR